MSTIEYNSLLFEISERIDELNALQRLVFICRGKLTQSGSGNVHDGLSLFKELEEHGYLGIDRLKLMKELLKSVKEWSLIGKVKKFENKRKEYKGLLEKIICALDELNDMERLITLCRGNIRESNMGNIVDVRSLFEELENQETLGIDCLDVVKVILAETGKTDLFKEVEEFEERRDQEDEFEAKKEQRAALMSSVRSTLMGVVNMKTVFKVFAGGLVIVSATEVLSGWSSYDQLVAAVQSCVLPAGTSLVQITDGCVRLTVQAESLSTLTNLWKLYQDGTLQKRLYDFFVTEVRELAEGEDVEVNVTIDEGEYQKACIELIPGVQGGATIDYVERRRRNSDSAVYFNVKELPLSKLKCLETEVKYLHNSIALLKEKNENLRSHPFEQREIAPTKSSDENFDYKPWDPKKMEKDTIKTERSEELESKLTMKLMGDEKMDFVKWYIENVHETYSMTTEASESGLGTRTTVSEEEIEDVRDSSGFFLKDLRKESIHELDRRLRVDKVGKERVFRFFGLNMILIPFENSYIYPMKWIAQSFPNTPVDLIRQCFEALQMNDLVAFLKPISLRPVLSPGEVETLRTGDLPTKSHNNVLVLVVNDSTDKDLDQKIEGFFKELNSQNNVTVIGSSCSEENRKELNDLKMKQMRKKELSKEVEACYYSLHSATSKSEMIKMEFALSNLRFEVAELEKEMEMNKPLVGVQLKVNEEKRRIITSTMDNWIQNQEKFTAVFLAFIINEKESIYDYDVLAECVASKLSSLPYHTKIVVGAPRWIIINEVPEMLSIGSPDRPINSSIFNSMIEMFVKRYHELDLVSMMREFLRTCPELTLERGVIDIRSNLSTVPRFEKRKEQELE